MFCLELGTCVLRFEWTRVLRFSHLFRLSVTYSCPHGQTVEKPTNASVHKRCEIVREANQTDHFVLRKSYFKAIYFSVQTTVFLQGVGTFLAVCPPYTVTHADKNFEKKTAEKHPLIGLQKVVKIKPTFGCCFEIIRKSQVNVWSL